MVDACPTCVYTVAMVGREQAPLAAEREIDMNSALVSTVVLTGLLSTLVGCVAATDSVAGEADDLSKKNQSYVTLRADQRKCASPMCGGFFVHDVNRQTEERYVSALDLSLAKLDDATAQKVLDAPADELVLRGKLGPVESSHHTQKFLVTEAYRGLPGVTAADGEAFYKAESNNKKCFAAPCPDQSATRVNAGGTTDFSDYSVERAALPYVQQDWLVASVRDHGAIVTAKLAKGAKGPGGYAEVLDVSQVFLRIPEAAVSCPLKAIYCKAGTVPSAIRDENRCVIQEACVQKAYCNMLVPACDEGYTRTSWSGGPHGCAEFACDPSFMVE